MKNHSKKLAQLLTYAGILPFLFLSVATFFKITDYDFSLALGAYAALIIAFLCGIHWAIYLFFLEKCGRNLFINSNVVTLIAWSSLLLKLHTIGLIIQTLCLIYLFWLDHQLMRQQLIEPWFFKLRRNASCIVCVLLISAALAS